MCIFFNELKLIAYFCCCKIGGPDVHAFRSDHDRESLLNDYSNRKTSFDSTDSSEYSEIDFNDSACESDDDCGVVVRKIKNQSDQPTRITLKFHLTENTFSIWETVSFF